MFRYGVQLPMNINLPLFGSSQGAQGIFTSLAGKPTVFWAVIHCQVEFPRVFLKALHSVVHTNKSPIMHSGHRSLSEQGIKALDRVNGESVEISL